MSHALESQLEIIFKIAKHFNTILLLNEADAFMASRTSGLGRLIGLGRLSGLGRTRGLGRLSSLGRLSGLGRPSSPGRLSSLS
ncbi:hypothetical protein EMCG_03932 [[Emmonsia] crescens]|uniref:ATPase AAA-type core domain-containing protein n=1 Tax=[Emmonsia] crescens TaxID=73230 RepID=A0A0G2HUP7_9EURO|nr:hypothetical protein EMCG_03932 [Emmonsia crescens UAMH 3008]